MLCLARFLTNTSLWADLEEGVPVTSDIPFLLLSDICATKGQGASYWQVEFNNISSLDRIVAAYVSTQSGINGVSLGLLPMTDISRLQVRHEKSKAKNPDAALGESAHYDVQVSSVRQALEMADVMRRGIHTISKADVTRHLAASIEGSHISLGSLNDKLLVNLAKDGYLKFERGHIGSQRRLT